MSNYWRKALRDIENALSDYDYDVEYHRPSDDKCGYYEITINDEYDDEELEDDLADVAEEWGFDIDWRSDATVDLNDYQDV